MLCKMELGLQAHAGLRLFRVEGILNDYKHEKCKNRGGRIRKID